MYNVGEAMTFVCGFTTEQHTLCSVFKLSVIVLPIVHMYGTI